jgi:hypothetical protein
MTSETQNTPTALPEVGFAIASLAYESAGYLPIPLDGKKLLVKGATGHSGSVSPEKVDEWRFRFPQANTGIVAHGWVAIDVDHHDDKFGGDQLVELERKHGKLPKTWKSSARGADSPAGQYFFRVEEIIPYESNPARDIEIIHPTHRYSTVAPSVHPTLLQNYVWYDPDGNEASELPDLDYLPELPLNWQLAFGKTQERYLDYSHAFTGDNQDWIAWLDDSEPTYFTLELLEEIASIHHIGHEALMKLLLRVRDLQVDIGERGTRKAFDAISSKYFATTRETHPDTEFNNLLNWVIGSNWEPTPKWTISAREIVLKMIAQGDELDDTKFWNSRNSLRKIHELGRKKVVAPYSLLGMVILRALHTVPWNIYYRSFRGTVPLNALAAFVGPTGTGKSLTLDATENYVAFADSPAEMGGDASWVGVVEPGSGEAIPEHYMAWHETEDGKKVKDWKSKNHSALFSFDEIGMLESRQAREGATIIEFSKQGWSGTVLGRELASGRGTMLPSKSYRFGLFVNIQPARAGLLFTPQAIAGGLPSRFLFFSTQDPKAKSEFNENPASVIKMPMVNWIGVTYIDALPIMNAAHREESFTGIDGGLPELDSHLLLTRAKVAVALAVMEGRSELIDEDWELSNYVINHSKKTRSTVLAALKNAQGVEIAKQGKAAGMKASIASEVEHGRKIRTVAKNIKDLREQGVPETGEKGLKKRLRYENRKYFDEAIEYLNNHPDA